MESPFSWRKAEHVVFAAIREHQEALEKKFIGGYSLEMRITNALREAGLLVEVGEDAEPLNVLPGRRGEAPVEPSAAPQSFAFPSVPISDYRTL